VLYKKRVRCKSRAGSIQLSAILVSAFLAITHVAIAQPQAQSSASFERLRQRAEQASSENRLNDAVRFYSQALALRPTWPDGWWSLGTLDYDQNHYSKAALAFKRLIQLQPKNGTAHAMLGLCQFELGADQVAMKNLLAADHFGIVNDTDLRNVALYHLGVLQLRAKRFGDAYETLHMAAETGVKSKELFTALGQAALLATPLAPASQTDDSASLTERVGEAESLSAQKQFAGAEEIYRALANQSPDFPNLHFAYGRMLLEARKEDEAIKEFRRELQRDPKNVNSMLEIASVEYEQDSKDGLTYAEKAVQLAPALPFAHYMIGMLRLQTGDPTGAIPELEIVRKAFPRQPTIYYSLGNAYARVGRQAEAGRARAEFTRLNAEAKRSQPDLSSEQAYGFSDRRIWVEQGKPAQ